MNNQHKIYNFPCNNYSYDYQHRGIRTSSNFSSNNTTSATFSRMDNSSKKQSWLEFINESMGSNIKNEAMDYSSHHIPPTSTNKNHYSIADSDIDTLHDPNSNLTHSSIQNSSFEKSNKQTTVTNGPTSPGDKRRCSVCSDVASGYHYGVWSCEGCKAFFKRSIQGTNEYICPATNTCTIDKHRRKSCQACRLRRCYEVGMTKGTTRRERKYRRKAVSVCKITSTSSNSNATANNTNMNNQEHGLLVLPSHARTSTGTPSASQFSNNSNHYSSPHTQMNKTTMDSTRIPITSNEFLSALSQASRLNLPAKVDPNRPIDDQYFLRLLAKVFDQELVVLINWAKAMPGYTESLSLDQQVTIIEQSWLDTLILDIIERSSERNDDALQFAPDFVIPRNRDLTNPILDSICTYLFNILQTFKEPRTTHEEFIALKATILINSIPTTISSTKAFRILTNQIYQTIQYSCDSNPSVYHDNYIRHFTLLLQLPHIKMLSSKLIRLFLDMRANELLPQADLLLEMLEAQDTFDIPFIMDVNNFSLNAESFTQNSARNNNLSSTSFSIDNSSLYPKPYSNIPTMGISKTNIPDLSEKRSSSTPSLPFYK